MSQKTCTPFCVGTKPCPKHHDLLVALLNCADNRSNVRHSTEKLELTVISYIKKGWKKDDDVQDPVELYRFPLVHWASVLGKCTALEWMLDNGFMSTVRSSQSKETALHRCIMCLYRAGIRRPELKMTRIVELLKDCLMLQDEDCDTPLHLAAKRLVRGSKPDYYGQALDIMILQARVMPGKTAQIIDCTNKDGNTIAHILAQNDVCISTVRKILESGTDLTIKNQAQLTPLEFAINSGSTRIAQALTAHVKKAQTQQQPYDSTVFTTESPPESPVQDANEMTDEPNEPAPDEPDKPDDIPLQDVQDEPTSSDYQEDTSQVLEEIPTASEASETPQKEHDLIPVTQIKTEIFDEGCCRECPNCRGRINSSPVSGCCDRATQWQEDRDNCSDSATLVVPDNSPSKSADLNSSLISFLKGAGLLENMTKLANKTRLEDEHSLKEKLQSVQAMNNTIAGIEEEMEKKTKALEELNTDLKRLSAEKETVQGKRKRINDECSELQTKLHCCDSLLRFVPQLPNKNSEK